MNLAKVPVSNRRESYRRLILSKMFLIKVLIQNNTVHLYETDLIILHTRTASRSRESAVRSTYSATQLFIGLHALIELLNTTKSWVRIVLFRHPILLNPQLARYAALIELFPAERVLGSISHCYLLDNILFTIRSPDEYTHIIYL